MYLSQYTPIDSSIEITSFNQSVDTSLPNKHPISHHPHLVGRASHEANCSRRVNRHSRRLADRDGPKALVSRSLERARSEDVFAAVEGGRDEDVSDGAAGGYQGTALVFHCLSPMESGFTYTASGYRC